LPSFDELLPGFKRSVTWQITFRKPHFHRFTIRLIPPPLQSRGGLRGGYLIKITFRNALNASASILTR
ncbi:hypothetical protein K9N50_03735, partial [bacterium]|nr:hypothetical protein [bacterium]